MAASPFEIRSRIAAARAERGHVRLVTLQGMPALAPQPAGAVALRMVRPPPQQVQIGRRFECTVGVTNNLPTPLFSFPPHPVHLVTVWRRPRAPLAGLEGARHKMPGGVASCAETLFRLQVDAPEQCGAYELVVTMVQEGVAWLNDFDRDLPLGAAVEIVF